jgi:hypothetical protein
VCLYFAIFRIWSNEANKQWALLPTSNPDTFKPGPGCPYLDESHKAEDDELAIQFKRAENGAIVGFEFQQDTFVLLDKEHLEYDGFYICEPKLSGARDLHNFGEIRHGHWISAAKANVGGNQVGFWGLRKKNPNENKLHCLDDCPYTDAEKYPWVKDAGGT